MLESPIINEYFYQDSLEFSSELIDELFFFLNEKEKQQNSDTDYLNFSEEDLTVPVFLKMYSGLLGKVSELFDSTLFPTDIKVHIKKSGEGIPYRFLNNYYFDRNTKSCELENSNISFLLNLNREKNQTFRFPIFIEGHNFSKEINTSEGNLVFFPDWVPFYLEKENIKEDSFLVCGDFKILK